MRKNDVQSFHLVCFDDGNFTLLVAFFVAVFVWFGCACNFLPVWHTYIYILAMLSFLFILVLFCKAQYFAKRHLLRVGCSRLMLCSSSNNGVAFSFYWFAVCFFFWTVWKTNLHASEERYQYLWLPFSKIK